VWPWEASLPPPALPSVTLHLSPGWSQAPSTATLAPSLCFGVQPLWTGFSPFLPCEHLRGRNIKARNTLRLLHARAWLLPEPFLCSRHFISPTLYIRKCRHREKKLSKVTQLGNTKIKTGALAVWLQMCVSWPGSSLILGFFPFILSSS
jgi:hypothetical protein